MTKSANKRADRGKKSFDAVLERMRSRLNWTIIRVPFDAAEAFGVRGQIKVRGTINSFPFRSSLFPVREGGHILLVNKRMQREARVSAGVSARFEIERDMVERTAIIPEPLKRILAQDRSFRRWYDQLNHSTRYEIAKWVLNPTVRRHADAVLSRLRNACWKPWRRKGNCLRYCSLPLRAIPAPTTVGTRCLWLAADRTCSVSSYYRTPEGRAHRIDKMLEDTAAMAEKKHPKRQTAR